MRGPARHISNWTGQTIAVPSSSHICSKMEWVFNIRSHFCSSFKFRGCKYIYEIYKVKDHSEKITFIWFIDFEDKTHTYNGVWKWSLNPAHFVRNCYVRGIADKNNWYWNTSYVLLLTCVKCGKKSHTVRWFAEFTPWHLQCHPWTPVIYHDPMDSWRLTLPLVSWQLPLPPTLLAPTVAP